VREGQRRERGWDIKKEIEKRKERKKRNTNRKEKRVSGRRGR
jgi:hypothetical protein